MKKILLFAGLALSSFAFNCEREDEMPIDENQATDIDLVTGLHLRESNGLSLGTLGNPNTKTGTIEAFPNPADDALSVHSNDTIMTIWLAMAEQEQGFQGVDFDNAL